MCCHCSGVKALKKTTRWLPTAFPVRELSVFGGLHQRSAKLINPGQQQGTFYAKPCRSRCIKKTKKRKAKSEELRRSPGACQNVPRTDPLPHPGVRWGSTLGCGGGSVRGAPGVHPDPPQTHLIINKLRAL